MDSRRFELLDTPVVVMLLVLMCSISALWVVSCSWISSRKKRQRVADNVSDLVLEIARPVSSTKVTTLDRYSVKEPAPSSSGTDNLGSTVSMFLLPIIVITPPSPTNPFFEVSSVKSDSSIGSAEDLLESSVGDRARDDDLFTDGGGVGESDIFGFGIRTVIRDSMKNKISCFSSSPSSDSDGASTVYKFPSLADEASNSVGASCVAPDIQMKSNSLELDIDPSDTLGVPQSPHSVVGETDMSFSCVALPENDDSIMPPQPRLSTLETHNVELQTYLSHHL